MRPVGAKTTMYMQLGDLSLQLIQCTCIYETCLSFVDNVHVSMRPDPGYLIGAWNSLGLIQLRSIYRRQLVGTDTDPPQRDYPGTRRTRRRVVLYSELEIIQEHGEHGEELCYTQSQRLSRNTENTEKSCVILRARDYPETWRTRRRVVLYSELEIIQKHREHGEELCYTQRQILSRNMENKEKSCVILRARDYTGTRRRVVLYSELEIIQEHGEQGEELSYTQKLLSIHFMKVIFVKKF